MVLPENCEVAPEIESGEETSIFSYNFSLSSKRVEKDSPIILSECVNFEKRLTDSYNVYKFDTRQPRVV